ncbi:hypothetical protein [Amycolatopsis sp. lyj-108]|uniref:hypothetical protein n=1 Tax=Amycolatopsis sp. lyj-108 TaxID=2789286 RepID=UPI003978FEE8
MTVQGGLAVRGADGDLHGEEQDAAEHDQESQGDQQLDTVLPPGEPKQEDVPF